MVLTEACSARMQLAEAKLDKKLKEADTQAKALEKRMEDIFRKTGVASPAGKKNKEKSDTRPDRTGKGNVQPKAKTQPNKAQAPKSDSRSEKSGKSSSFNAASNQGGGGGQEKYRYS